MVKKYEIKDVVPNKKFANNGTQDYIALDGHLGSEYLFKIIVIEIHDTQKYFKVSLLVGVRDLLIV